MLVLNKYALYPSPFMVNTFSRHRTTKCVPPATVVLLFGRSNSRKYVLPLCSSQVYVQHLKPKQTKTIFTQQILKQNKCETKTDETFCFVQPFSTPDRSLLISPRFSARCMALRPRISLRVYLSLRAMRSLALSPSRRHQATVYYLQLPYNRKVLVFLRLLWK